MSIGEYPSTRVGLAGLADAGQARGRAARG